MATACVVLAVEDEPLIRLQLADMLEDQGCTTFTASNATEAIAVLEENSSITVKRWPPTIIVVSSGKVRPSAGELSDDIAFLPEPYDDQRLAAVISDVRHRLAGS